MVFYGYKCGISTSTSWDMTPPWLDKTLMSGTARQSRGWHVLGESKVRTSVAVEGRISIDGSSNHDIPIETKNAHAKQTFTPCETSLRKMIQRASLPCSPFRPLRRTLFGKSNWGYTRESKPLRINLKLCLIEFQF